MLFFTPFCFFSFLRCLNLCPEFLGHVGKWIDKEDKVDSKMYDATHRKISNYNIHMAQYLQK